MIFTIGHRNNYGIALINSPEGKLFKLGRQLPCERFPDGYAGGYAFQSETDAQRRIGEAYAERGFAVFGLLADWEKDTYPNPQGNWWRNLINDAEIVFLDLT